MDDQIEKREWRFKEAALQQNTTRQWQLIAAAVEEANIIFHKLTGREATKMRGRSKVTFRSKTKDALKGMERSEDHENEVEYAKWMQKQAGEHAKLGNKLINTARRMKANADTDKSKETKANNEDTNRKTIKAYLELAEKTRAKQTMRWKTKGRYKETMGRNKAEARKGSTRKKRKQKGAKCR